MTYEKNMNMISSPTLASLDVSNFETNLYLQFFNFTKVHVHLGGRSGTPLNLKIKSKSVIFGQ